MPGAARGRGRRRAAPENRRGERRAPYHFIERRDGVRIEHPRHGAVDLRVDGRHFVITSGTRHVRCSLFTPSIGLARLVAGVVLELPDDAPGEAFDAIRREIWTFGQPLQRVRRRLLDRHAADFSAVEQRMLEIRGTVPRLARSPQFYRTPYLARDVCHFRAAAIALAFLEDELWPPALTALGRPPGILDLYRVMRAWRGLFAPSGTSYRSLDRTLMSLSDAIYPALVCVLRQVRLERPIVDPVELRLLLECVALARQRRQRIPWLHALQHARAAAIRAGLARIAAATHRAVLDPADPSDLRFVATYLLDAQAGAAERLEHVVSHAIRRHAAAHRRPPMDTRGIDDPLAAPHAHGTGRRRTIDPETPTARPPLPPPDVVGLRFLASVGEIADEAHRMRHCIGTYARRAVTGDCFLFHAEHGGASASIEVGPEGRVRQATGPGNRHNAACEWARRELARWIAGWPPRQPDAVDDAWWDAIDADMEQRRQQMRLEPERLRQQLLDDIRVLTERLRQRPDGSRH